MLDDRVYRDFTSPYVRAERVIAERERDRAEQEHTRAEQEHTRAEQEHTRAEQERQRADAANALAARYAALLRESGIDPDA